MKLLSSNNLGLVFSWGGFVFLSVNFFVGASLASVGIDNFLMANFFAFVLLAITMYAPVYISIENKVNFSDAMRKYIVNKYISSFFILLVVLINIGWYSIQIEAVRNIFDTNNFIYILLFSYIFAFGAFLFGYKWLKSFSVLVLFSFLTYTIYSISQVDIFSTTELDKVIHFDSVVSMAFVIYGTWAFSSSSVIMDISKNATSFFEGYLSLLGGLVVGNFLLIFLGYFFARSMNLNSFEQFIGLFGSGIGMVLLVLNIWSTNDNNFYNSMLSLEKLNISHKVSFLILPLISAILVLNYKSDLFGVIGNWLILMGYIGVIFTLFWWYILLSKKTYLGEQSSLLK